MPEIFAVVNPVARGGAGLRAWKQVLPLLEAAGVRVVETFARAPRDAWRLAERAATEGHEIVASVGGDGTLHEVLNGLLGVRAPSTPALAVFPMGTANIFAHALGLPKDPRAAARVVLEGTRRRLDVGQANDRFFATVAGVGFDAEIARRAARWPAWINGKARHAAAGVLTLAVYRSTEVRLHVNGVLRTTPLFLLAAANTAWYGGGIHIAPEARPDDGLLSVVIFRALGRLEALTLLRRSFSGRHLGHAKVDQTAAREVRVESDTPLPVQADGEEIGVTPVTLRCLPGALEVFVPRVGRPVGGDAL